MRFTVSENAIYEIQQVQCVYEIRKITECPAEEMIVLRDTEYYPRRDRNKAQSAVHDRREEQIQLLFGKQAYHYRHEYKSDQAVIESAQYWS